MVAGQIAYISIAQQLDSVLPPPSIEPVFCDTVEECWYLKPTGGCISHIKLVLRCRYGHQNEPGDIRIFSTSIIAKVLVLRQRAAWPLGFRSKPRDGKEL
jgi:hypothetical protein